MLNDNRLPPHFWAKVAVNPDTGCWLWTASVRRRGYGRFGSKGDQRAAHRVAYEALVGPIPEGLQIDHLCRVTRCVNPEHLEPVTQRENVRRGHNSPATRTQCPHGHEYTASNTMVNCMGWRVCFTCNRAGAKKRRAKAKAAREAASPN